MIELDIVSHDMFDLPPLSEYELYVKKFGADDTRQVSQMPQHLASICSEHSYTCVCMYIVCVYSRLYNS